MRRKRARGLAAATLMVALLLAGTVTVGAETAVPEGRDLSFGIAEGHKHPLSKQIDIGWQRLVFSWSSIQPGGPWDWRADFYLTPQSLQTELDAGLQIVGLLQFTPGWAQMNPEHGERSLPRNYDWPWDHPENHWGQFTRRIAQHYAGRIDHWVIWNEPEIRFEDAGGGSSWTFAGGPEEYYQLLKVAYRNIKAANPNAQVIFAGTAYWLDRNAEREQFFRRVLDVAAQDPEAWENDFFFDIASFNLYGVPDGIYRIHHVMKAHLQAHGIDKPLWITETNAMPYDPEVPCAERYHPSTNPSSQTLDNQTNFAIQALAMAAAAGWERVSWYQMTDSNTCAESAIWGLVRDDGSPRDAYHAFRTGVRYFSHADAVTFKPLERWEEQYHPWPRYPGSLYPNWQVVQVVFDRGPQRVQALWNADGQPLRVRVPFVGTSARLVDKVGNETPLTPLGEWLVIDLEPATARGPFDPTGYHQIGGDPVLIVQEEVPEETPVIEPRLGDPGSAVPGFNIAVAPAALVAHPGESVSFAIRTQGIEGFADPVSLRLLDYSTQRFPDPVPQPPDTLSTVFPESVPVGDLATFTVETHPGVEPGIHFFHVEASGPGQSNTFHVVVQVEP